MLNQKTVRKGFVSAALIVLICGCGGRREGRREESSTEKFQRDESEYVLTIVFDMSGSFSELMAEDGHGYDFALSVMDEYFRSRSVLRDKIILAQLSGTERSLLWEGTPLQLRRDFPSPEAFRDFLIKKSEPDYSFVNSGLAHIVEYVSAIPRVRNGNAKSAIFVLSDMNDNSGNSAQGLHRLENALADYSESNGTMALYYVDQLHVFDWKQTLEQCGLIDCHVESQIVGHPQLPTL